MDWNDLKFLLAVAEERTLAGASRRLKVDPTTVGRRIIAVEQDLGVRLYDRTPDGFLLTDAGKIALEHARTIEAETRNLLQRVEGSDNRVEGPVRLTGLDALFDHVIIPRLPELLNQYPGLELTLSSALHRLDLSRREADIAIRTAHPTDDDAVGRRLARCGMAAYAARDFGSQSAPRLVGLPQEQGDAFARILERHFPGSAVAVRANTERQMLLLTRAGLGIGVLDCFVGDTDPALRRFRPATLERYELWAITHVDMARLPRVRAVVEFLSRICRENAAVLEGLDPAD